MSVEQKTPPIGSEDWYQPPPERVNFTTDNGLEVEEIRAHDPEPTRELYGLISQNPQMGGFTEKIKSVEDIRRWIGESSKRGILYWIVRQQVDDQVIGFAGRLPIRGDRSKVEVSYAIDKEHTGQGNATAVLKALTKNTFETKPVVNSILARIDTNSVSPDGELGNPASVAVLNKAGFKLVSSGDIVASKRVDTYRLQRPWDDDSLTDDHPI